MAEWQQWCLVGISMIALGLGILWSTRKEPSRTPAQIDEQAKDDAW
jgi:hypothetical protein